MCKIKELQERYQSCKTVLAKFEDIQSRIESESGATEPDRIIRVEFEDSYYGIRGQALSIIEAFTEVKSVSKV